MSRRKKKKPEPKQEKKGFHPRQRLFTEEYRMGDKVSIVRSEHGWYDGSKDGTITSMTAYSAVVTDDEGYTHDISHPRDIRPFR